MHHQNYFHLFIFTFVNSSQQKIASDRDGSHYVSIGQSRLTSSHLVIGEGDWFRHFSGSVSLSVMSSSL